MPNFKKTLLSLVGEKPNDHMTLNGYTVYEAFTNKFEIHGPVYTCIWLYSFIEHKTFSFYSQACEEN